VGSRRVFPEEDHVQALVYMPFSMEGIVLYSEDLDRARTFYRDVLGLPLLLDEGHVIHFDAGTIRLAIHRCPPGQRREAPEGFLVFGVDNLSEVHKELTRRGAVFMGPPADRPYGRVAYLHDPEGHEIGLLEEPRKGSDGHRRVAPLVHRYERVIGKLDL
jgi:predicted enzyme related to lactoylglutathione lyase